MPGRSPNRPRSALPLHPHVEELEDRTVPSAGNRLFVAGLFEDMTGHPIAPHLLRQWSHSLDHNLRRSQLVARLLQQTGQRSLWRPAGRGWESLVRGWYHRFLHQPADNQTLRALVKALRGGAAPAQVLAHLLSSPTYLNWLRRQHQPGSQPPPSGSPEQPPTGPQDRDLINRAITTNPGVQQMPSVAVDPHDSSHVVIAYMDYSLRNTGYAGIGVAISHDGGDTWQQSAVPLPAGFDEGAANPIVPL